MSTLAAWLTGLHHPTLMILVITAAIATGLSIASYAVAGRLTHDAHVWLCAVSLLLMGIAIGVLISVGIIVRTMSIPA